MLMTPPAVCPYSAEKFEVWTVNSCTVSGENVTTARPRPTPVFRAPSARIDVLPARPPLMNRFMPGVGIADPRSGSSEPAAPLTLGTVSARSSTLRLLSGISTICLGDGLTVRAGLGVDERRLRGDGHLARELAEIEPHVDRHRSGGVHLNPRHHRLPEAGHLHRHPVLDGVELRRREAALLRRREGERRSGPDVGDGHRRARHDGSAAIGDRARDPALVGLGDRDGAEEGSGNGGKRSASSHPCLRWSWSEAVFISLLFVRIIVCTHLKMGGQNPYLASRPVPRCGTLRQGAQWHSSLLPQ